jgi:uncharacterized membrane protein
METRGQEVHLDSEEARAGSTPGVARYVLMISLVLVVIAFAIIVMTGSLSSNHANNGVDDSARAAAEQSAKEQKQQP